MVFISSVRRFDDVASRIKIWCFASDQPAGPAGDWDAADVYVYSIDGIGTQLTVGLIFKGGTNLGLIFFFKCKLILQ